MNTFGVGASVLRKEDDRLLRGRGKFVGDIQLTGTRHVAFLRSPTAHGYLHSISIPNEYRQQVFVADDLQTVAPIRACSNLPGFKPSDQPVLVRDKVRHVGELIAMCVADTRAEAEDIVDTIEIEIEELPAIRTEPRPCHCQVCCLGDPYNSYCTPVNEPDRGTRSSRHLGHQARTTRRLYLDPAVPYRTYRAFRMSWN